MFSNAPRLLAVLGLSAALVGCDKDKASTDPETGSNLLGPSASASGDGLGEGLDEEESEFELDDGEELAIEPRKELPPPAKPVEKCRTVREGKQKKKECGLVDPKPKVSAAHGVYTLMGDFRWGMSPSQVFKVLSRDIEKEYEKRQADASTAVAQDENRRWRRDQLQELKGGHTKFTSGAKHRWGVSLIQYEYQDDAEEEMLWVRTTQGLRKFYFFKNGELWKIFYAYSPDVFPGMGYEQVVEEKFKKWFGPSPEAKVKQDPETAEPLVRYYEWEALDGEKIRSFDMTQVHGVIALSVIDGAAEGRIGERLPSKKREESYENVVEDVLGGSDVCYDKSGDIVECSEDRAAGVE